jgi:Fe-S cluster assembly ATP-binding protein
MKTLLTIKNLHVAVDGTPILKGLNLTIFPGEIHAIMGPNGAGKSTLAKVLAGHPAYEVLKGDILLDGESVLEMDPEVRTAKGLFMSFQYPPEIAGVSNEHFLFQAHSSLQKAKGQKPLTATEFAALLREKMSLVSMREEFMTRSINEGFSGGEKKRNEILQMAILDPVVSILDETDSGLDIDAMRIVAKGVLELMTPHKALILITHYQRLLDYIRPHHVHVMIDGKITQSGGPELAHELEEKGYCVT